MSASQLNECHLWVPALNFEEFMVKNLKFLALY